LLKGSSTRIDNTCFRERKGHVIRRDVTPKTQKKLRREGGMHQCLRKDKREKRYVKKRITADFGERPPKTPLGNTYRKGGEER